MKEQIEKIRQSALEEIKNGVEALWIFLDY